MFISTFIFSPKNGSNTLWSKNMLSMEKSIVCEDVLENNIFMKRIPSPQTLFWLLWRQKMILICAILYLSTAHPYLQGRTPYTNVNLHKVIIHNLIHFKFWWTPSSFEWGMILKVLLYDRYKQTCYFLLSFLDVSQLWAVCSDLLLYWGS